MLARNAGAQRNIDAFWLLGKRKRILCLVAYACSRFEVEIIIFT